MRIALRLLFAALAVLTALGPARAERRVAMVVGIDAYSNLGAEAQLQRAVSDADSVSASLHRLGFDVRTLAKGPAVTQDYFEQQFSIFEQSIHSGDIAVFYFAGHGVSFNRSNYLAPADVPELVDPDTYMLRKHTLEEAEIRERMQSRGPAVVLLMLDACRNNPFPSRERGMLSRGLQPMQASNGALTIYAAGEGQTALDRLSDVDDHNPNSVFTRVVLKELNRPGLNLVDFGEDVRDDVAAIAREAGREQIPEIVNHLVGGRSVYLGSAPIPAPPPPPSGPSADEVAWTYVQGTNDTAILRRFLAQFPDSRRRDEAQGRLASLERPAPVPTPAVAPPAAPPADEAAWMRASSATDPAEMRAFLLRYPGSSRRAEAEEWLRVFDDAMWHDTPSGDATAQRRYLELFPGGAHTAQARAQLASLEQPPARAEPTHVTPPVYRPRHVMQPAAQRAVVTPHRFIRRAEAVVAHEAPPRTASRHVDRIPIRQEHRHTGGCFTFAGEIHCQ